MCVCTSSASPQSRELGPRSQANTRLGRHAPFARYDRRLETFGPRLAIGGPMQHFSRARHERTATGAALFALLSWFTIGIACQTESAQKKEDSKSPTPVAT